MAYYSHNYLGLETRGTSSRVSTGVGSQTYNKPDLPATAIDGVWNKPSYMCGALGDVLTSPWAWNSTAFTHSITYVGDFNGTPVSNSFWNGTSVTALQTVTDSYNALSQLTRQVLPGNVPTTLKAV